MKIGNCLINTQLFSQKNSSLDGWHGSEYAPVSTYSKLQMKIPNVLIFFLNSLRSNKYIRMTSMEVILVSTIIH